MPTGCLWEEKEEREKKIINYVAVGPAKLDILTKPV